MKRTERSRLAWLALAGLVLLAVCPVGGFAAPGQTRDLDPLGHSGPFALPPPDRCYLFPLLAEPLVAPSALSEPEPPVTDDGYRLPLASRAPPEQA